MSYSCLCAPVEIVKILVNVVPCFGKGVSTIIWLVVEPTHLKNMLVKLDHLPKDRGENSKNI